MSLELSHACKAHFISIFCATIPLCWDHVDDLRFLALLAVFISSGSIPAGSAPPLLLATLSSMPGLLYEAFLHPLLHDAVWGVWDSSLRRSRDSRIAYLIGLAGPGRPN